MKLVYVAGPYSTGDTTENIANAVRAGLAIMRAGHSPFVPHAHTHIMAMFEVHDHEEWLAIDIALLSRCDALFRLPGESPGAKQEIAFADESGIPVFTCMDDLLVWCGISGDD